MTLGPSAGQALATARRAAGMTLEDVAAATRIRRTIIAAIEDDDFSLCSGDFYTRAHIRGIAQAIGADPTPVLDLVATEHPAADEPGPLETLPGSDRGRRTPNWSAAMAVVLVLVLGFGVYRVAGSRRPATDPEQGRAGGVVAAASPSAHPMASATHPAKPRARHPDAIARAPVSGVNVRLSTSVAASWVSVTNGAGQQLFIGLLRRGVVRSFSDPHKVRLVIGDAGAVSLAVNGKLLGTPGRSGSVARVEFVPGDPAAG